MNHTFLIFILLIIAMMLAVIDQQHATPQLNYQPWQTDRFESGMSRVFGITLGKTTIQEANQIFANFAETRLTTDNTVDGSTHYQLTAHHNQLVFNERTGDIQLRYQLSPQKLQSLYENTILFQSDDSTPPEQDFLTISMEEEMRLLNTPIDRVTFIPSVRYGEQLIQEQLGPASEHKQLEDGRQILSYPDLGLMIIIAQDQTEKFIYSSIKKGPTR